MSSSLCLRYDDGLSGYWDGHYNRYGINYAMDECAKNKRCVGIEYSRMNNFYRFCLDAIITNIAWTKYENFTKQVFKKMENHGRYIS